MTCIDKTLYIHGFLGESDEISFLEGFDLYKTISLNDREIVELLESQYSEFENVIAYSMGGRFVFKFYEEFFHKFNRVNILSSHYGLSSEDEKKVRKKENDSFYSRIDSNDFLDFWNGLEIFKNDAPISKIERARKTYKGLFNRYRLEEQNNFKETIELNGNIRIFLGEKDKKYKQLYSKIDKEIVCIPDRGHRLNDEKSINEVIIASN